MPDLSKKAIRNIRFRPGSQTVLSYGRGAHGIVGSIGYYLPGSPDVWPNACLEGGEAELIFDSSRLAGGGNLLDLGTHEGGSAILMAQGLIHNKLKGHVYTVDTFGARGRARAEGFIAEAGLTSLIDIYQLKTRHAVGKFCGRGIQPFGFIFIDACHDYDAVLADWHDYSPLLTEEGLIAFHDANDEPTIRVIEEIDSEKWDLVLWVNRIKVFKKR